LIEYPEILPTLSQLLRTFTAGLLLLSLNTANAETLIGCFRCNAVLTLKT